MRIVQHFFGLAANQADAGRHSRPLTPGEIALAKCVFGDAIDYGPITIHRRKYLPVQRASITMTPNGNLYLAADSPNYQADFSAAGVEAQHHFIHEMTHVFQFQKGDFVKARGLILGLIHQLGLANVYAYRLDEKRQLADYNLEQQGDIVADYFALQTFGRIPTSCQNRESATVSIYQRVISFLPCDLKALPPQTHP